MNYFEKKKARRKVKQQEKNIDKNKDTFSDVLTPSRDMVMNDIRTSDVAAVEPAIGSKEVMEATTILLKYKQGKTNTEKRIIENEQWWKRRHWEEIRRQEKQAGEVEPTSAWLFNCIMSKYADYMDAYPEPNILPREEGDKAEAKKLSSIVPVVLEQNGFKKVYSKKNWKILKDGAGVYGVFWDGSKLNGLGDITIKNIDGLNLFWEPGITDIQDSANVFHVNLVSNTTLEQMYPELKGKLGGNTVTKAEYIYDDNVDTTDKSAVVEWYYKKWQNGRNVLHYVKYVGEYVIYASENDTDRPTESVEQQLTNPETGEPVVNPETGEAVTEVTEQETGEESIAERGWYDHGKYPFIVEVMFPIEGSLYGFSYIDICKEPQKYIDLLDQAVLKNALMNALPRWFVGQNANINEDEFLDWQKSIVHVSGSLDDLKLRQIPGPEMNGAAIQKIQDKINEMKETTGNTDVARGNVSSGLTSGSAISALQESAGKTSRSQNLMSYEAYGELITMVIELIRQFYDVPRQFRILGKKGYEYIQYSNENIKEQEQESDFDVEAGYRVPTFDVEVVPQKANPYSKNSQNELALQLYNMGFFAPQNGDVALTCLDAMDFAHKDDITAKIQQNATLYNENVQLKQQIIELAAVVDQVKGTTMAQDLTQSFNEQGEVGTGETSKEVSLDGDSEHPFSTRAREQAQAATQVNE